MKSFYRFGYKTLTVAVLAALVLSSCGKEEPLVEEVNYNAPTSTYSAEVALKWNELFLELERFTPGYRPPVSARASAYIGLAAYEAVLPGMAS